MLIALGHRDNETQQCTNGGLADGKRITLREDGRDKWGIFTPASPVIHASMFDSHIIIFFVAGDHTWMVLLFFFCFSRTQCLRLCLNGSRQKLGANHNGKVFPSSPLACS